MSNLNPNTVQDRAANIMKMFGRDIVKAEGSRGGRVIGHTKSGKPIYAAHLHPKQEEDYTSIDHTEAAEEHKKLNKKYSKGGSAAYSAFQHHAHEAGRHQRAAETKKTKK